MTLMARRFPLFGMTPNLPSSRTVVASGELRVSEICQHILEVIDGNEMVYPIPSHPVMRQETGHLKLVSPHPSSPSSCFPSFVLNSGFPVPHFARGVFSLP